MADKPKDHPDFNDTLREGGEEAVRARILNFEEAKSKKKANGEGNGDDKQKESAGKKEQDKEQTEEKEKQKQVDVLVKLAREKSSLLFHSSDGETWADIKINEHRETWAIRSRGFKRWLIVCYAEENAAVPSSDSINRAIDLIDASAAIRGDQREVYVRVAGADGNIFIDLCDGQWRCIRVTANGWSIISDPQPVRFRRSPTALPLPIPQRGGDIKLLRKYLNVASDDDFALVVCWMTSALRPSGPYVVLAINGEHGSSKSTFAKVLRAITDPNAAPIKRPPREERDLFIAAAGAHVISYDNLGGIQPWLSDALCTISTEGGFSTRRLYTDCEEQVFYAKRPIIVNGINNCVTAPDLADRTIFVGLDVIDNKHRRVEEEFWADFEIDRPKIFGALLDAVVHGLEKLPATKPQRLPRMADFARWATASEGALFTPGTFERAYASNQAGGVEDALDADPVASAIRAFVAEQERDANGNREWTGTCKELLIALIATVIETVTKSRDWPKNERGLRESLKRAAPFLRRVGINIAWSKRRTDRGRLLSIRYQEGSEGPSGPSGPSGTRQNDSDNNDIGNDGPGLGPHSRPSGPSGGPSAATEDRQDNPGPSGGPSGKTPYESIGRDGNDGNDDLSLSSPQKAASSPEQLSTREPPPPQPLCHCGRPALFGLPDGTHVCRQHRPDHPKQ